MLSHSQSSEYGHILGVAPSQPKPINYDTLMIEVYIEGRNAKGLKEFIKEASHHIKKKKRMRYLISLVFLDKDCQY